MNSYTGYQTVTPPKRAVVVGGGFIGLEMVENLIHRGLDVTLIEKLNQVMPPLDVEMARLVERYMVKHGVRLELNDDVAGFEQSADGSLEVLTSSGKVLKSCAICWKRAWPPMTRRRVAVRRSPDCSTAWPSTHLCVTGITLVGKAIPKAVERRSN